MRLRKLEDELGSEVEVQWRSFLLRPHPPEQPRSLEEFRAYTQSWLRPAAEEPEASFRVWEGDESPPSYSMPPHLVAKAAAQISTEGFERVHDLLLESYFADNRNITDESTLREIWERAGLESADYERSSDPEIERQVVAEHSEALDQGASGAPAVAAEGNYGVVMGAQPVEVYRRWVERLNAG